ncbi:MAG TPA: UDP-glucose/GDP-mannose dehydrogenase family protein [Bacteroidales bacterium]|nr:UDP-glucose/GDP-mannose dehydrogenase family protein [Bacteroidales bacterium]
MKITVVGTGYVGLVTGTCFAEIGINVYCVDIDENKINNLQQGIVPIYEPGLDKLIETNTKKGRLHFTTKLTEALQACEVVFIAVGTPPDEDGSADLSHVLGVASEIGKYMQNYMLVVTKSTVPVGTACKVKETISNELKKRNLNIPFDIASNPEFLKEGAAVEDFLKPDRIVIGVESNRAKELMSKLYQPFVLNGHPVIFMDIPSAEMTKYAANAMLATKISFMNDIANLCEIVGANVNLVRKGIGSDSRIGNKFIYPGIGYGGSCFPKDVKALIKTAQENNYNLRILQAVEAVNNDQKTILLKKLKKHFKSQIKDLNIAIWGLSFKPLTDDIREAPSLVIIEKLIQEGANVIAYDPEAIHETKKKFGNSIKYASNPYEALNNADSMMLLTEWHEFRFPDWNKVKKIMKQPVIFDGRNIYDGEILKKSGFIYYGIGV